jgi:hypothetical protein
MVQGDPSSTFQCRIILTGRSIAEITEVQETRDTSSKITVV